MNNPENIVKEGFVSAEKYAELLARLQHVEAYAAEKENQLMTEYEIKSMVLGKKNYLFCENEQSCFWAAMMYSFFGGCRAVGANEVEWLTYVLDHIKTTPADQLYTLLPQNWIKHRTKKPKRR